MRKLLLAATLIAVGLLQSGCLLTIAPPSVGFGVYGDCYPYCGGYRRHFGPEFVIR